MVGTYVRGTRLTGEVRHRAHSRLFRAPLLVIQVQEEHELVNAPTDTCKTWRDARVEDFDTLRRLEFERQAEEALRSVMRSMGSDKSPGAG